MKMLNLNKNLNFAGLKGAYTLRKLISDTKIQIKVIRKGQNFSLPQIRHTGTFYFSEFPAFVLILPFLLVTMVTSFNLVIAD